MKDRIKLIMEKENLTPAKFADKLQINRAIISHILNGRNNPSLDVVTKILSEMDYINSEWLINGTGNMYKEGYGGNSVFPEPDLFNQDATNRARAVEAIEKSKEKGFKQLDYNAQLTENKMIIPSKNNDRKITQIIIYYDDNTFEIFGPHLK
ncbi:DNA-binding transcriptional regulator, XRE-family HTH domain [Porphyromonadaceae bacterium NLAE-zl-C104]|uniref:helix-turn-helix domain-containing protein n=1 Tax=Proteiniphilum TaxID=294702 RepID=UPI0008963CC1|nr:MULTISPECIES: helix-turn-helix transcriptional regulator [Proteiniphilum]MDY9918918.1 helix-turn-helix transcriptional regulator [Proteiniphilum sp.]SEA40707.1 DNA-binding transcriptional regulator, XRE-family HTH domain [Porphyromonadaceae bacterium KH3R12]SFS50455.1 DNA-binding transcriptional regulator, XRE-family HTH domain [Porphyromonadaceae bacterium NLAE-zl-C104]